MGTEKAAMTFRRSFVLRMASDGMLTLGALINSALIVRMLGFDGKGYHFIMASTVMILSMLFGEVLDRSNAYMAGRDRGIVPRLLTNTLWYSIILGVLLLGLFFAVGTGVLPPLPDGQVLWLMTLLVATATVLFRGLYAIFLGLERMHAYNALPVGFTVLYVGGNILALKVLHYGLYGVMGSWLIGTLVTCASAVLLLSKEGVLRRLADVRLFKSCLQVGAKGMVIGLLMVLLVRVDVYLIRYFLGAVQTGIYSIAMNIMELIQKAPNVAGTVLFSKIASKAEGEGDPLTAQISRMTLPLALVGAAGLLLVGPWLIPWVFTAEDADAADAYPPLVCMMPGVIALACGSVVNTNLWTRGYPAPSVIAPGIALLIKIVLNVLLVPRIGLIGAGLATSVAYILWASLIFRHFLGISSLSLRELTVVKGTDFAFGNGKQTL